MDRGGVAMTSARETRIVDLHHHDRCNVDVGVREGNLQALILKATEGLDWCDPLFEVRFAKAWEAGVLVGAYHFASGNGSGASQADHFVARVRAVAGAAFDEVLLILDWETNPSKKYGDMSVANAEAFVSRVHELTGRWPVFYSFTSYMRARLKTPSVVLGRCALWQAQYGERPSRPASPTWQRIELWQYTNGGDGPADVNNYPRSMPGFGGCDRSVFEGDSAALHAWWRTVGR